MSDSSRKQRAKAALAHWAAAGLLIVAGILIGRMLIPAGAPGAGPQAAADANAPVQWYTCPMHPQVRSTDPKARCPICQMALVEVADDASTDPSLLRLSEAASRLAAIEVAPVAVGQAAHTLRLQGRLEYDETAVADITAWVEGRIDRLYADYTGMRVRAADHMVRLYSPQLLSAQAELIQAANAQAGLKGDSSKLLRESTRSNYRAAEQKLRLAGLSEVQVRAILDRGTAEPFITINTPVGGVVTRRYVSEGQYVKTGEKLCSVADPDKLWLILEAYEADLPWLKLGNRVRFTLRAAPGRSFDGLIGFIDPQLDPTTHTARVRINVQTGADDLRPGMLALATIESRLGRGGLAVPDSGYGGQYICPMHPSVRRDAPGACPICSMKLEKADRLGYAVDADPPAEMLLIPASAVLHTGRRDVVYVRSDAPNDGDDRNDPDAAAAQFDYRLRVVTLGPRTGDRYVVLDGLNAGELVVVEGAFKIDSERQLRAKPSMISRMADADGRLQDPPAEMDHEHNGGGRSHD